MSLEKNALWEADERLFVSMKGRYQTPNEENFFKNLQYKQENECSALNDLLVSEYENEDEVYVVREGYDEYVVGVGIGTDGANEEHVMCLAEALGLNLRSFGVKKDMTLWEWLRECDYSVVNYERNYDIIEYGKRS